METKRKITPEKAMAILKAQGTVISITDAEALLDFLYFMAELFYNQHAQEL
ncbi:MAG: hypothetical protein V4592_13935 [Bacteroidota bacterium]